MPPGLKKELGLGEPKAPSSAEQADEFKAAFQAAIAKVNEYLQYTAAYAEKAKHDPQAAKRDKTCQAYQVALSRIDPTNPSAAQSAIDQVLAGVQAVKSAAESLKAAAEKAYEAWTGRQTDVESVTDKIREMVEWGQEKAGVLQQVLQTIVAKANERAYEEAHKGLDQLVAKLEPLYEEYKKQKAAKEEYDSALAELQPRLDKAKACTSKPLATLQQELASAADEMQKTATGHDYVTALTQLTGVTEKADAFEKKVAELEETKKQFEDARKAIDAKLTEASTCSFKSLAELDQKIVDCTAKTDAAAADEDYQLATNCLAELAAAVNEKLKKVAELEAQKTAYESARAKLDPDLAKASTCKHEALMKLDGEIAQMTSDLDAAAAAEEYEKALQICGQLAAKVATKLSEEARIDRKVIGSAQKERADKKLEALSEKDRKRFNELAEGAKSPEELDYLTKALAANYSVKDIEKFAKKINGKDKDWLQNNLKLTGNTDGKGVKQQWSFSCNATTTEAIRGELDPIYALKLHEENKDLTSADDANATKLNPKLAKEQKKWLESTYKGDAAGKHKGVATSRDDPKGKGSGRWADDLMNKMSDVTGLEFSNKKISPAYKVDDAVNDIDTGLKAGHPVPIVIGGADDEYSHYVLVTGRSDGPPPTWTIHDVGSGKTITQNVQDVKNGTMNVGGYTTLAALDNPSVKQPKKKKK